MIEMMSEARDMKPKQLIEELELKTDEDLGIDLDKMKL